MKSATPKVLHRIAGRSLVGHALNAAAALDPQRIVVVVRHEREQVAAHIMDIAPHVLLADQDEIPGTGRAVYAGLSTLDATAVAARVANGEVGDTSVLDTQLVGSVVVTSGDVPLVDGELLGALVDAHHSAQAAVTLLTARVDDPTGYGRVVREAGTDTVLEIVEDKDASDAQREITEINAGIYVFDAAVLRNALMQLGQDNAQGEMYLTDVIAIARADGGRVQSFIAPDAAATEGVNDRVQLAKAGKALNKRILRAWMREGVTIVDPATTWIDADVTLEQDAIVLPGTQLYGKTRIGSGTVVGPDTTLTDVEVGDNARVLRTHAVEAVIGANADIGPFAHLRPGSVVGEGGKIGEFVGVKNSTIGADAKVPHLSYVGDAEVGEGTNVGAGTIFVNYDGVNKHHTSVGAHVRIGSDNTLIAPLEIGDGAYTGAGTTVRHDVPPGALAINASGQKNIEGWVERRRAGTTSAEAATRALNGSNEISSTPSAHEGDDSEGDA